ncbi:MAG: hypothetical protein KDC26_02495 [Armatimonadetes bacterium]|nr:hypothetical protein [Armatimonadota bacterium]
MKILGKMAWVIGALVILMVASGFLLLYGDQTDQGISSTTNTFESGTAALKELLVHDGFQVRTETSGFPQLESGEVIIYEPLKKEEFSFFGQGGHDLEKRIDKFLSQGERGILLNFSESTTQQVTVLDGKSKYVIHTNADYSSQKEELPFVSMKRSQDSPAFLNSQDAGAILELHADGLTNSNIELGDNAKYYLEVLRRFAGKDHTIVFLEATMGNRLDRGLMADIGPWATVAWYQFLFLMTVIAFSVGKRFGVTRLDSVVERGTSETLIAMSDNLKASRHPDQALMILLDDAYERIRAAKRASPSADPAQLHATCHQELKNIIQRIRSCYGLKLDTEQWIIMAQILEEETLVLEREADSLRAGRKGIK